MRINTGGVALQVIGSDPATGQVEARGTLQVLGETSSTTATGTHATHFELELSLPTSPQGGGAWSYDRAGLAIPASVKLSHEPVGNRLHLALTAPQTSRIRLAADTDPSSFKRPGVFYQLPQQSHASLYPLGSSQPSNLSIQFSGQKATWPQIAGVQSWVISFFNADGKGCYTGLKDTDYKNAVCERSTSTRFLNQVSQIGDVAPLPYSGVTSVEDFLQTYLPGNINQTSLVPDADTGTSNLVSGKNYIMALTGFGVRPSGSAPLAAPPVVAYTSKTFVAP